MSSDITSETPANRRVFIETFGCQMNELDSELVQEELAALGFDFVNEAQGADVVLYNTCSVRDLSEQKVLSRLGRMKQRREKGDDVIVGVLGCMAERAGTALLKKNPHIDLMAGPSELDRIPGLLNNLVTERANNRQAERALALSDFGDKKARARYDAPQDRLEALDALRLSGNRAAGSRQAFVRITRGCNKFCNFCVVPRTRGPEVHRPAQSIIDEVKHLVDTGVREVTLLGQTINHYAGVDAKGRPVSFAELLRRVHDENPDLPRLRFLTSYPRDFTDEALDVMAGSARMCRYLHIPAQSGNDRVLKMMNRGYTRDVYMDLIERARARMPDIALAGDMIVGFPTETDAEFEDSMQLLRDVQYKMVYVFKYSPRPGTVSGKRDADDVPVAVKKARNNAMLALQQEISAKHHADMVGQTFEVLVEGAAKIDPTKRSKHDVVDTDGEKLYSLGKPKPAPRSNDTVRLTARTRGDHIVAFDGPESLIGELVNVKLTHASGLSLKGERVP